MGYYENCCQICAVSFNIARLRLAHESQKDGWGYSGPDYYMGEPNCSSCVYFTEVTGCENVHVEEEGGLNGSGVIHYPGRGCTSDAGYNGNKIGAMEMNVSACVVDGEEGEGELVDLGRWCEVSPDAAWERQQRAC